MVSANQQPDEADYSPSLISMQELEPSPIEESPVDVEMQDSGYFPKTPERSSTMGSSSSLGGHSLVYWRKSSELQFPAGCVRH
jgi:hypothetical protein